MFKTIMLMSLMFFGASTQSFAWEGYDNDTGNYIEIESYDHGGQGEGEVEYYDYESGEYKSGYLDMESGGSGTLYDYESGEYHDVDME
ncbi:MAG: hypothetical protein H0S80_12570 [Desulfovibrionaceae bacterium]|nr:hypothetical protein [Desulfovibrionaceae bacterium]